VSPSTREERHAHTGCSCKNVATSLTMQWRSSFGRGTGSWDVALKKQQQQPNRSPAIRAAPQAVHTFHQGPLPSAVCGDADGYQARHSPLRRRKRACASSQRPCPCSQPNKSLYHSIFSMADTEPPQSLFRHLSSPSSASTSASLSCWLHGLQMNDVMRSGRCAPEPTWA
jgi:hypothetical protein